MICSLSKDFVVKSRWVYGNSNFKSILKTLLTDGTFSMVLYRIQQSLSSCHLGFLGAIFLKVNSVIGQAVIGRGAWFDEGFVILHSTGIVINGKVRGGKNILLEHGVTIGEEKGKVPILGNDIFIGAGAKIFGGIRIGDGARIGANAVVVHDVPPNTTAVGIPARHIPRK